MPEEAEAPPAFRLHLAGVQRIAADQLSAAAAEVGRFPSIASNVRLAEPPRRAGWRVCPHRATFPP